MENSEPAEERTLPITACPFCGHAFKDSDRALIAEKLIETNPDGNFVFPQFRIICNECHAEVRLMRRSDYYDED